MGVGNLSIGIDKGGAQVFGNNPAIAQFADILAQRQAKKERDNQYLNEELAKNYDPTVLRNDADKQEYLKRYSDVKQQAIDAENESNPQKRAMAIANVRQQLSNLSAWGEGSKKQGVLERALGTEFMKNGDKYHDEAISKYKSGKELKWDDPNVIRDPAEYERKVDPDKMDAEYKKYKQSLIEPTKWDNGTKKVVDFDGKKTLVIQQNRGIPIDGENGAYVNMLHYVTAHPDFKKGLEDRYPEINTGNPQTDMALRTRKYMHDMGDVQGFYDKPKEEKFTGREPVRPSFRDTEFFKVHGYYPVEKDPGAEKEPDYVQTLAARLRTPETQEDAAQKINSLFAAHPAYLHGINIVRGKDGQISGIEVPAKYRHDAQHVDDKSPNSTRVQIADKHVVPLNPDDPEGFDNAIGMIYKEVTGDAAGTPNKMHKKTGATQGGKTVTASKLKSLVGQPGYEGYSEQEIINYYKSHGYTVK